jgi:general secretion pathway protein I
LSQPPNPDPPRTAGFTLIEALAALTVMMISMAAIAALANSSMRSSLHVERHLAQIETARKIIAGLPSRKDLAEGSLTGALDNHQWRLDAAPFPNALTPQNAPVAWEPVRLALRVLSPTGAVIEIDTIRLRKRAAP